MDLKICRICLNNTGTSLLFQNQNDIKHSEKLSKCVNIEISEGDGFPNTICDVCAQELAIAYNFICKCENSDRILRSKEYLFNYQKQSMEVSDLGVKEEVKLEHDFLYDFKNEFVTKLANDIQTDFEEKQTHVKAFYPCDGCSAMFLLKDGLKKHKNSHHSTYKKSRRRKIVGPLQCSVCGLVTQSRYAMAIHHRTHTGEKPFSCKICNMKFTARSSLKRHIKIHEIEKFVCDRCSKVFASKSDLIEHINNNCKSLDSTTQNTYYACQLCPKTYRQISSVIRHQLSHTGERRHSCPMCQKSFYRKYDVQRHMKSMHNDKTYSCHICKKVLKNENLLVTHLKTHTNEKMLIGEPALDKLE